jgi:NTP pyrophosphatase (non-canonical NTP hydrolase)
VHERDPSLHHQKRSGAALMSEETNAKAEIELLQAQLVHCTKAMLAAVTKLELLANDLEPIDAAIVKDISQDLFDARGQKISLQESDLNRYQQETRRTAANLGYPLSIAILALGITSEAGEVADLIKKSIEQEIPFELDKLKLELGDCLWGIARLADEHGISLKSVADGNIKKLAARYPEGFKPGGGVR